MKLVIVESPFAGSTGEATRDNILYARFCARYGLTELGESGWGSHMIWPQFLDDAKPDERELGIAAGLSWGEVANYHVFYTDRGWSRGMLAALDHCILRQRPFRIRGLKEAPKLPPEDWLLKKSSHVQALIRATKEIYS